MFKRILSFLTVMVFTVLTSAANATVMTFGDGPGIYANGYTEAGMTISTSSVSFPRLVDWQSYPGGGIGGAEQTIGERELLDNDGAIYTFSLLSGETFDLLGLDIEDPFGTGAHWSSFGTADIVGSNSAVVTLSGTSFATHLFGTTFSGISSFQIVYAVSSQVTFDNINFETTVPEPATLALMGLGLAGLGFTRRKAK